MQLIKWASALVLLGALLGLAAPAAGQSRRQKIKNLPQYDERNWRYGFQLGIHRSRYNIRHDAFYAANGDSTTAIYPTWTPGFMVGLIVSKRLGSELWNLRFTPNVTFYERTIRYEFNNNIDRPRSSSFEQTTVEFPLLLKYKSVRRVNNRMYMLAGVTPAFSVGTRRQRLNDQALQVRNFNLEINYGFGFDLYFEMFKFAPEIRFSHGVPNLLMKNGNLFSNNLDRITTHRVALILNFE